MKYACGACNWHSGDDTEGPALPEYTVVNGVQRQVCPECYTGVGEPVENNLSGLADRF